MVSQEVEIIVEGKLIVKGKGKNCLIPPKRIIIDDRFGPFYREIDLPEEIEEVKANI